MFFKSRLVVATVVMILLFSILLWRIFSLQIVNGKEYQDNYTFKIVKERTLNSTRGNIYDRNGNLLAYNELAYSITIEDNGTYSSTKAKNAAINAEIAQVVTALEENGDSIVNDFKILLDDQCNYSYNIEESGATWKRFLADVFGEASFESMQEDESDIIPATNLILNRRKQPLHRLCNIWRAATVMPLEPNMMMQWHIRLLLYVFPWHKMPIRNILQQRSQRTFPRSRLPISANTLQNCRGLKY